MGLPETVMDPFKLELMIRRSTRYWPPGYRLAFETSFEENCQDSSRLDARLIQINPTTLSICEVIFMVRDCGTRKYPRKRQAVEVFLIGVSLRVLVRAQVGVRYQRNEEWIKDRRNRKKRMTMTLS